MAYFDEHGVPTAEVPRFVTPDTIERWLMCSIIAVSITRQPVGHPESTLFASTLFNSPAEIGDLADAGLEGERIVEEAALWRRAEHPVNRLGQFVDTPDAPKPKPKPKRHIISPAAPQSPGTYYTEAEIEAAGLAEWPEKTAAATALLGDKRSTAEMYALDVLESPGTMKVVPYSVERTPLHDKIIAAFFEGKTPPAEGTPLHAVFSAGGPASGKTGTLKKNPDLLPDPKHTIDIDPDLIKDMMNEYTLLRGQGDRYAATAVHRESGDIAARLMFEAMEQGFHVVVDGTGNSDPGEFKSKLDLVREDYKVDLVYVNTPTEEAVRRAITRAEESGRFVPIPVVRSQHRKVSLNFMNEIVDLAWLNALDVIDDGDHIATWKDGSLVILDNEKFAKFALKAEESPRGR